VVDLRRAPVGEDNRPYYAPNMFPSGHLTQFTGIYDDVENGVESGGDLIGISSSETEEASQTIRFIRQFYLGGGAAVWKGAVFGDWVSLALFGPATAGTSNEGAGVYDKYPIGAGMNMYIPNATQTGDWDLNLSEKLNENVSFTKVVPIPATAQDGFFNYDKSTGVVTLNPTQTGKYNLFDFKVPLHVFVNKVVLVGDSVELFTVPAIKPYLCLPHWEIKLTVYNSTAKSLELGATLYRGVG